MSCRHPDCCFLRGFGWSASPDTGHSVAKVFNYIVECALATVEEFELSDTAGSANFSLKLNYWQTGHFHFNSCLCLVNNHYWN